MVTSLQELANDTPSLRRYVKHGFDLLHPLFGNEDEFKIVSVNQILLVNRHNSDVRPIQN